MRGDHITIRLDSDTRDRIDALLGSDESAADWIRDAIDRCLYEEERVDDPAFEFVDDCAI